MEVGTLLPCMDVWMLYYVMWAVSMTLAHLDRSIERGVSALVNGGHHTIVCTSYLTASQDEYAIGRMLMSTSPVM